MLFWLPIVLSFMLFAALRIQWIYELAFRNYFDWLLLVAGCYFWLRKNTFSFNSISDNNNGS